MSHHHLASNLSALGHRAGRDCHLGAPILPSSIWSDETEAAAAARWREAMGHRVPSVVFLIGSGGGAMLDALERMNPAAEIILVEPDPGAAERLLSRRDWTGWILTGRLTLLVGPDFAGASGAWRPESLPQSLPVLVLPELAERLPAEALDAERLVHRLIDEARANAEARRAHAGRYLLHTLANAPRIAREGNVSALGNAALNQPARAALAGPADLRKVLVNMERWRWLPDDLGALHVWNNLPEFETRLVKGGTTMHQERIIIGKPETQTPVFSDRIRFVVFQPEWGVPSSIKVKSLLPSLQDGDYDVLERRNMRISVNGRTVDPGKYDWDRTDIRRVPIVQDAGPENPLGQMKFMFPNRHDVYMHDTPAKGLFNAAVRTFSHGCIRVRNPRRLAEIILAETSGRTAAEAAETVAAGTGTGAKPGNRVDLARAVPVHNTYFTLVADTAGGLRSLPDIYGHDRRIAAVLDGRPASVIREQDPALKQQREIEEIVSASNTVKPKKSEVRIAARKSMASPSFLGALFGN